MTAAPAMTRVAKSLAIALSSDNEQEILASVNAMRRVMAGAGIDHHEIARALCASPQVAPATARSSAHAEGRASCPPLTVQQVVRELMLQGPNLHQWEYDLVMDAASDLAMGDPVNWTRSAKLRDIWQRVKGDRA